jgi:hypothetical protein
MNFKISRAVAALCLLAGLASPVSASSLTGDVISGSYDFPDDMTTNVGGFSYFNNPFVVSGPAAETTLFVGNPVYYEAWNVFFDSNSLTLTMAPAPLTNASYTADPFNGPVFTVVSGNGFGSVTNVITNLHCTPCTPVTAFVSGNSLFVNWEGAGGQVGDTITVDLSVDGPITPLPAALPLFAAGLGGLGLLGWRRTRKAQADTR